MLVLCECKILIKCGVSTKSTSLSMRVKIKYFDTCKFHLFELINLILNNIICAWCFRLCVLSINLHSNNSITMSRMTIWCLLQFPLSLNTFIPCCNRFLYCLLETKLASLSQINQIHTRLIFITSPYLANGSSIWVSIRVIYIIINIFKRDYSF